MQRTFSDWITAMGCTSMDRPDPDARKAIQPGGSIIHEVGGAIMGSKPSASVTNAWSQTWDVRNVFVADGGVFASNADKNPTLTIMALAWRTADRILDELRKGNL
jgi:choline dehydrogenase-like flavoprotein